MVDEQPAEEANACSTRRTRVALVSILAVALIARLIAAWTVDEISGPDALRYHQGAVDLLAGQGFRSTAAGPLYSAFLAAIYHLFGMGNVAAVQVAQALLGTASVALIGGSETSSWRAWRSVWRP